MEYFIKNYDIRQDLGEVHLKKVPDLSRIFKKFHSKRATLQDCYRIYLMLKILPQFTNCLSPKEGEECVAVKHNFSDKLNEITEELSKLTKSLEGVIDEDRIESNGEFWIKADYDDDLKELRNQLNELEDSAKDIYKSVDKELSRELKEEKSIVKLESSAQGFVFKLTRKNETCIRHNDKYFEVKNSTKKDGFRFQNKQLKKLNDEYIRVRSQYDSLQNDLSQEIIEDTGIRDNLNYNFVDFSSDF